MATAMINNTPSIFWTPSETPTPVTADYSTRIAETIRIATKMVAETLTPVETEIDWLNDPETIESLNAWYDSRNTPEAREEYDAWVTEQERIAIQQEAEFDELCERFDADAHALATLGETALEGINGHDLKWQGGLV